MDCDCLLHIIGMIPTNKILSIGFRKIGYNAAALKDQMIGIIIIILIVHRWLCVAEKRAVYRSLAVSASPTK